MPRAAIEIARYFISEKQLREFFGSASNLASLLSKFCIEIEPLECKCVEVEQDRAECIFSKQNNREFTNDWISIAFLGD